MGRRRRTRAAGEARAGGPPRLAGHEIVGPVGFGAGGALWSARDQAGHDVVVSVLALPTGAAGEAQLRRLAVLRQGTHPHLALIRQVVSLDATRCAVVSDRVPGPTLATVVAARGRLAPGELATVLNGIGSALGHLHERGIVHGDVSPSNVVLNDDGTPVLVDLAGHGVHDLGTPGFAPPERATGGAAGAPGDVWALARLVEWAGGDPPEARLVRLLAPALDDVPGHRPAARDLASGAPVLGPGRPVLVPPAAALAQARMRDDAAPTRRRSPTRRRRPAPGESAPARGRPRRRPVREAARHVGRAQLPTAWLGAALSVGVAALLTGLIVWTAPGDRAGGFGHRPAAAEHVPSAAALGDLLARRDAALVAGDAGALAATTVPGGPAAREDVELLDRLQQTGTVLQHLRTDVTEVQEVVPLDEGTALDVVLVQEAHDRVVAGEHVTVPAQPPGCVRIVLLPVAGEAWQILQSAPCP